MAEPLPGEKPWSGSSETLERELERARDEPGTAKPVRSRRLRAISHQGWREAELARKPAISGRNLGKFRNTYYYLPNQRDFDGPATPLQDARCRTIASVPRAFFEALCVQGSGLLDAGSTVSFAKRDCACAELCPRTEQRICFDVLPTETFPWGRGATGKPIVPLLTLAVDSSVIPLGTAVYIPELDGLPRDADGAARHDGCFLAEDRGLKVKGRHVDVFMGEQRLMALWNRLVPSNQGVSVVLDTERCARATPPEP
jgi:3D (Asp-Asp-Asp) domain-containing protein